MQIRRWPLLPATITLLLGLALTAALGFGALSLENTRTRLEFRQRVSVRVATIEQSFREAEAALDLVNTLFRSSVDVTREEFDSFARTVIARNPYIQALVFHRLVTNDERARFEAERRKLFPGFTITESAPGGGVRPAGQRPLYLVDDYIFPLRGNEITLGFDTWTNSGQRERTDWSIAENGPVSSPLSPLLQRPQGARGIIVVSPVYRQGQDLSTVQARRAAFKGDTELVIDAGQLIGQTLASNRLLDGRSIDLKVYGPGEQQALELAFSSKHPPESTLLKWLGAVAGTEQFARRAPFVVAGRPWQIDILLQEPWLLNHLGASAIFVFGTLISLALALWINARSMRTHRIEQLVGERTSSLRQALDALRLQRLAIESSANAIIITRIVGQSCRIEYVNAAFARTFGYKAEEVLGADLLAFSLAEPAQPGVEELRAAVRARQQASTTLRQRRKDGSLMVSEIYMAPVMNESGETTHLVFIHYDVTAAKAYERELEYHAKYDGLTGLANRSLLIDRLDRAIMQAQADKVPVWVAVIDIDHFRVVNDTLGHQGGDELLRIVASRIEQELPATDTIARMSGGTFLLVLNGRDSEQQAASAVEHVLEEIALPASVGGQTVYIRCSAGVSAYPQDGTESGTLIRHAEIAMYRCKELGGDGIQFFTSHMNRRARERLELETALRGALERHEFEVHYQPQLALASGEIVGAEALIRWRHPERGLVPPDRFISIAEETGLITRIGHWVLRSACAQAATWERAGYGPVRIGVNLSARQFRQQDLQAQVARVLADTRLPANCLEIEVTESMVMADVETAQRTMHALRNIGAKISIDDFGTGYSSLAYLKLFPVDVLKIDQSFVRDIGTHPDNAAMVGGIISLARGLRMHVIAEGVETDEQLAYLRRSGCDEVQGFLVGRALPAEQFEDMLRQSRRIVGRAGGRQLRAR